MHTRFKTNILLISSLKCTYLYENVCSSKNIGKKISEKVLLLKLPFVLNILLIKYGQLYCLKIEFKCLE